nr:butyrophilin-like protein 10 isoform X2 [Cavia porcellus]
MQPWALYFKSLLLWLLPWPGRGQFQVKTPKSSVIVQLGKAAVLPCHLSPSTDAQNMEIRWYRDDQSVLLHEYRNSQDHMDQQSLEYQGRTELLRENINQGQVALRIHPILARDEGQYSCVFVSSTQVGQAQFELLVAASGAPPHIHIQPADTEGITLTCSSSGWYPDPELQWRDPQGQPLSPDSETRSEQEDGLIYVESSVTMTSSSRAPLCCWIGNPVLREEKEERLSVAEALFPRVSNKRVEWTVMLVLPVLTIIIAAVILLRSRRCREGVNLFGRHGQKEAKRFAGRGFMLDLFAWGYVRTSTLRGEREDMRENS